MMQSQFNKAAVAPALSAKESFGDLLGDLAGHSAAIVKNELELAKTELSQKISDYTKGFAVLGIGAVLLLLGTGVLCAAAVNALAFYVGYTVAALIVGGVLLLASCLILWIGIKQIKEIRPSLDQSIATLEEIVP